MSEYQERASYHWTADSVRLIATPSAFAKQSLLYVQEVGHFRTLPGYFTEREGLGSFLAVYTVSGKGVLHYRGKTYELLPGDSFWIDCMDFQRYATDPIHHWEMYWVHMNGGATRAYYEQYVHYQEGPVVAVQQEGRIPAILPQLVRLHEQFSFRTEFLGSQLLVELLTALVLQVQQSDIPLHEPPAFVEQAVQAIRRGYAQDLSLTALAEAVAVSKYHFAKTFKRFMGVSPGEYIIMTRISGAKNLLKYTDIPVARVAEEVGVEHVSHFIRLFKERTGVTPLAYRRKWQRPGK